MTLAVVGAHMRGMPLNPELRRPRARGSCGAAPDRARRIGCSSFPARCRRSPACCASSDGAPRSRSSSGGSTPTGFGALVAAVPGPLTIGDVRLADGATAKGYLVEAEAVAGRERHLVLRRLARLSGGKRRAEPAALAAEAAAICQSGRSTGEYGCIETDLATASWYPRLLEPGLDPADHRHRSAGRSSVPRRRALPMSPSTPSSCASGPTTRSSAWCSSRARATATRARCWSTRCRTGCRWSRSTSSSATATW